MKELDEAIASVEESLGTREGEPVALTGGITNRNFRARLGGRAYVVRLHGARTDVLGIDRESERMANEAAASLGIAPAVAAYGEGFLVTEYVTCSALEPAGVAARAAEVARALRAFHDSGVRLRARFDVPSLLDDYAAAATARGAELPGDFAPARLAAGRIADTLGDQRERPCHNDLLAGNVIATDDGRVLMVDWEYAGMGHAYFDLGNVSVNNDFDADAEERLLGAYLLREPEDRERATLKLMRVLSDAREAAWGVLQGLISELEFDFEGYARAHFERMRSATESAEFEEWLAAAS
jgi:aminoglycoside phosphotransferase (APT) family kinase protein